MSDHLKNFFSETKTKFLDYRNGTNVGVVELCQDLKPLVLSAEITKDS